MQRRRVPGSRILVAFAAVAVLAASTSSTVANATAPSTTQAAAPHSGLTDASADLTPSSGNAASGGLVSAPSIEPIDYATSADGKFFARSLSVCGRAYVQHAFLGPTSTNVSRLPAQVAIDNPSRAVPSTNVFTYETEDQLPYYWITPWFFVSDPSGRGPGYNVTLSWPDHYERIVTEPYVDNCAGTYFAAQPTRVLDTRTGVGRGGTVTKIAAGSSVAIDATSPASIPDDYVTGVVLNVTATNPETAGYLTVYPCNSPVPQASSLNFAQGQTVPNMVQLDLIGYPAPGNACVFSSAATDILVDVVGFYRNHEDPNPIGTSLTPFTTPKRILDTRSAVPVAGGTVYRLDVAGQFGVPAGATALSINITATDAQANGYLTSYPCGVQPPDASNVNFVPGKSTANATIAGVGDGAICIFASATTHLLVDLVGYFDNSSDTRFWPQSPSRVLDSRPIRLPAKTSYGVYIPAQLTGSIVALNVTVTDPLTDGYLTVYPCDQDVPEVSNINFAAHDTVANAVVTRTSPINYVCLWSSAEAYFIIDMNGYASLQGRFDPLS